jgi:hypothetical protein
VTLIPCPECTTDVSDAAAACPHCGSPVAVAVGLAAIAAGILSVSDSSWIASAVSPPILRPTVSFFGVLLIFTASLTIDSVLDGLRTPDWRILLKESPTYDPNRRDQFPARLRLFNRGYASLSIFLSFLTLVLWGLGFSDYREPYPLLYYPLLFFAFCLSIGVTWQMMTDHGPDPRLRGAVLVSALAIFLFQFSTWLITWLYTGTRP